MLRADGYWRELSTPIPAIAKSWLIHLPCTLLAIQPAGMGEYHMIRWDHNGQVAHIRGGLSKFYIEYDPKQVQYVDEVHNETQEMSAAIHAPA